MWMLTESGRLTNLSRLNYIVVTPERGGKFRVVGASDSEHITISSHDTQKAATDALLELRSRLNASRRQ